APRRRGLPPARSPCGPFVASGLEFFSQGFCPPENYPTGKANATWTIKRRNSGGAQPPPLRHARGGEVVTKARVGVRRNSRPPPRRGACPRAGQRPNQGTPILPTKKRVSASPSGLPAPAYPRAAKPRR